MTGKFFAILMALLLWTQAFCSGANAADENPRIDNVIVTPGQPLKASFVIKNAFSPEILEAVQSGIPTSFNFIIKLEKVNKLLPNEHIGSWEYRHTVKYDTLKEEYELRIDEKENPSITIKSAEEMKAVMAGSSVLLETDSPISPNEFYEIRVKAELKTIKLPFFLDYMLFFLKFWDLETSWHAYRFTL